ncbi:E3 ubiquitin-protein ligase SPL2 [Phoenix dactylifera]|uniref:RING-type E3 ubiquitin transferase n=1 Tax=Phoenix dactylifera TaxID=42345 RepID=A0A8B9A8T3_PHODC|nr:E3 ubiquitin-protein ligase SPL2 [Phoenix dactylifera]XP_038983082.1 E3 ubiquitin-protein ligase SPL2 [Phoenix dactylifera]
MSRDYDTAVSLARIAAACDGAFLGVALAICAARSWFKYVATTSALHRIRDAPAAHISDLRSLLPGDPGSDVEGRLVVVRGQVQPRPAVESSLLAPKNRGVFVSESSGERAVVVQHTETCLYNEWRGMFGWSFDLHALFVKSLKEQRSSSLRTVPFALVEGGQWPHSGYVHVSLDGSAHPIPLTTVYHHLRPVQATPYTFFQAIFGSGFPVALLHEEKILPVGKEITAVGICRTRDGSLEIKSCEELPYFLSDMTKDEIVGELATNSGILFWSGIVLGTVSIGILSYSIIRYWWRWKERRWRNQQLLDEASVSDDESEDVPDGELCVICLMRQRRCAFVPCGHRVCCPRCTIDVKISSSPKCPVCRQSISSSIRIYDS